MTHSQISSQPTWVMWVLGALAGFLGLTALDQLSEGGVMNWTEYFVAAMDWMDRTVYVLTELRHEILTTVVYVDALLILLGLTLYVRMKRQRRSGKEKVEMRKKHEVETELFEVLVNESNRAVEAAEKAIPLLEYAITSIPDIDQEGEVRRFRDVLLNTSAEMKRQTYPLAMGPETIKGIRKNTKLIWDTIHATERIRGEIKLRRDKHALTASENLHGSEVTIETILQHKRLHERSGQLAGFDPEKFISAEGWGNAITASVYGGVAKTFISQLELSDSWRPEFMGKDLLSPPSNEPLIPRLTGEIVEDEEGADELEEDDRRRGGHFPSKASQSQIEGEIVEYQRSATSSYEEFVRKALKGGFSENGSYHSHLEELLEDEEEDE